MGDFGKLLQQRRGIGVNYPAAGDYHRAFGHQQHRQRAFNLRARGNRFIRRERRIQLRIKFDFRDLDIIRQVD